MNQQKKFRNSLSRIHSILATAADQSRNRSTRETWAVVFQGYGYEFSSANAHVETLELAEILSLFYRELTFAWAELDDADISNESLGYQDAFESVCEVLSVVNLSEPWGNRRDAITPGTLAIVGLSARLLPATNELDEDDIATLLKHLAEIEINVSAADLAEPFKQILFHHIRVMRDALKKYRLIGANALREALKESFVDTLEHDEEFRENTEEPVVGEILSAWKRLQELFHIAKATDEGTSAIISLSEKVLGAFEKITK